MLARRQAVDVPQVGGHDCFRELQREL
jgi:hypothetical protein